MKLSIFLITLGVVVVAHADSGDDVDTAKGLTYLGVGYDVLKGNPEGGELSLGGVDPGLRSTRRILQLTWENQDTTVDGKYRVPDQVSFAHHESCVQQSKHQMYSGSRSYQQKLMEDVQSTGGNEDAELWNSAFSLSERFEQASSETQSSKNVYFETKKVCNRGRARYKVGLAQETEWPVTREFASAACNLPAKYNKQAYMKFIEDWGTHIVLEVELGIKSIIRYESKYTEIAAYATENSGSSVSVSGGYMGLSGALANAFEMFKESSGDSSKFTELKTMFTSGGPDMPAPIGLKLLPIYQAFSRSYFTKVLNPQSRCTNLVGKQKNVKRFLKNYASLKGASIKEDPAVRIPLTWPQGTYGLPMTKSGCPGGSFWHEGTRYHDTFKSNSWSNPYDLAGRAAKNDMEQKFCMKTEYGTSYYSLPWPRGQYCIFRKGGSCPAAGFEHAVVMWVDAAFFNKNRVSGEVPDGNYGSKFTVIAFCCRTDGFASNAIFLPTDSPFVLMKSNTHQCQQVKGMQVREEYFKWDSDDYGAMVFSDNERLQGPVNAEIDSVGNLKIKYCYYYK